MCSSSIFSIFTFEISSNPSSSLSNNSFVLIPSLKNMWLFTEIFLSMSLGKRYSCQYSIFPPEFSLMSIIIVFKSWFSSKNLSNFFISSESSYSASISFIFISPKLGASIFTSIFSPEFSVYWVLLLIFFLSALFDWTPSTPYLSLTLSLFSVKNS